MPFYFDMQKSSTEIREVKVNPDGWVNPVTVEYTVAQAHKYDTTVSVIWRVKGTEHCFTISEQKLNVLSHANYQKHFEEVLRNFRIDYLNWFTDPTYENADWKYEYKRQFDRFILPETDGNKEGNGK